MGFQWALSDATLPITHERKGVRCDRGSERGGSPPTQREFVLLSTPFVGGKTNSMQGVYKSYSSLNNNVV